MKKVFIFVFPLFLLGFPLEMDGRKVKTSYKIEKENKDKKHSKDASTSFMAEGVELEADYEGLKGISFVGYDKEVNSNQESFIIVNDSKMNLTGYHVRIDYLDMRDRMLHSREVKRTCVVPAGESRKVDISAWDTQKTYYYYLGNEPKKVATPFKVVFHPKSFWVKME